MDDGLPPTKEIRLSDAEREIVIAQLRKATDEGRISLLEFEDRAGQVYAAQFPSELAPVTADLPIPASQLPAPQATSSPQDLRATPAAVGATRWSVQIMGGNERRGDWNPGAHTKSFTMMGNQILDLTQVSAAEVLITSLTFMGGTEIIVPDGARVEFDGFILFGGTSNNSVATPGAPSSNMVVRVRAYGAMGGCNVRNLKRRERKKRGLPPR